MTDLQASNENPHIASSDARRFHRAPAVPRRIGAISGDEIRVRLLCRVIYKTVNGIIVEDVPTARGDAPAKQIEVALERDALDSLKPGDVIRLFARVLALNDGFELRGEIVQDMSALDVEAYEKIFKADAE